MNFSHRCLTILSLSSIVVLSACQTMDPGIQDCQKLLEKINATVVEAQNLTQTKNTNPAVNDISLETWLQAADVLKSGSKAIADLKLKDSTLKTYQDQISTIYTQQAQATYDMVKARQEKNLDIALKAKEEATKAGDREKTTGEALNSYCQAKKKKLTN